MHRQAVRLAERDNVSLNQFLVSTIATRIGAEDFYAHMMDKMEKLKSISMTNITLNLLKFNFPRGFQAGEELSLEPIITNKQLEWKQQASNIIELIGN